MAATPLFLITDGGLAAASVAEPTGPFIHITQFAIGSAFGYTPQRTDTGLNGNLLFSGAPTSYQSIGDNTINIICRIPPDAGPFDFGEVAIYLDGGVMFAKAVFDTLQTKFSSLGTNLLSTYTFNCLIKLEQSVAIFKIDTESGVPPAVWEVELWSDIFPPGISANPDTPETLCRELDEFGNSSLLHKASDEKWTLGTNYDTYDKIAVVAGTTTSVQFPVSSFSGTFDPTTAHNRQFVIEFADGFFRSVSDIALAGSNYQFNLNPAPLLSLPTVGSIATLYSNRVTANFDNLINVPLLTATVKGIAQATGGIEIPTPGIIRVNGLNHTATGTGRVLTNTDNLNNDALASGIYTVLTTSGIPTNYPPVGAFGGQIYVSNTFVPSGQGNIMQTWYPEGIAGGDGTGKHGRPIYFRSAINVTTNTWTDWFPFSITGKNPTGGGGDNWVGITGGNGAVSFTSNMGGLALYVVTCASTVNNSYLVQPFVNGINITSATVLADQYSKSGCATIAARDGDAVFINGTTAFGDPNDISVMGYLIG